MVRNPLHVIFQVLQAFGSFAESIYIFAEGEARVSLPYVGVFFAVELKMGSEEVHEGGI